MDFSALSDDYLDITPVRPPPPGRESNLIDPESRAYQVIIVIAVVSFLVVVLSSMRVYTRLKITRTFGVDDWLCIAATVMTLAYSGLMISVLDKPGDGVIGRHLWDVPLRRLLVYSRNSLADSILIRVANTTIKVAFFAFYLRLFGLAYRHVRIMSWIGIVTVVTFCVVFVVTDMVACLPWPGEKGGFLDPAMQQRCNRIAPDLVTAAVYFSVISDFYILFIPLHMVPKMGLSRKKKVAVSFVFLTGLLACGAGLANLIVRTTGNAIDPADFSWTMVPVYIACIIELNVGLMCQSMPIISAFFVGRVTHFGESLSSWIKARRLPRRRRGSGPGPGSGSGSGEGSDSDLVVPSDNPQPHPQGGRGVVVRNNNSSNNNSPPQISSSPSSPSSPPSSTLAGMRTFIRNIGRSRAVGGDSTLRSKGSVAQPSAVGPNDNPDTKVTLNDLTSSDPEYYHDQLRQMWA